MGMTDEEPAPPASPRKGSPLEADQAVVQIVLNLPRYSIVAMEPLITVLQSALQQHLGQGAGASSQAPPIRPLANRFRSDGGGKSNPSSKKLRLKQRLPLSNPQSAYHAVPAESDNMASKMLLPLETPDSPAGMEKDDAPNLVKGTPDGAARRITFSKAPLAAAMKASTGTSAENHPVATPPSFTGTGTPPNELPPSRPSLSSVLKGRLRSLSQELKESADFFDLDKDYRLQSPEALILNCQDVRYMLADVKKEQSSLLKRYDLNMDDRIDGNELELALRGQHRAEKRGAQAQMLKRSATFGRSATISFKLPAAPQTTGAGVPQKQQHQRKSARTRWAQWKVTRTRLWRHYMGPPWTGRRTECSPVEQGEVGCMHRPDAPWRRRWDMVGLLATLTTLIVLPMDYAFYRELERGAGLNLVSLSAVTDVFFILDLFVQFRSAQLDPSGRFDFNPRKAARKYLRGWFVPDLLAAVFPISMIQVLIDLNGGEISNTMRPLSLVKAVRMYRLVYVRGIADDDTFNPEALTMIRYICYMLLFWHWSGLLWWSIGGEGQVDDGFGPSPLLVNGTLAQKYIQSIYWSVAITSKVREPMPDLSRLYGYGLTIFSNVVIACGLIFQAMLTAAATGLVRSFDSAAAAYNRRLTSISSYLDFKGVPRGLKQRIQKYYRFVWSSEGSREVEEVMPRLPAPLKAQLAIHSTRNVFVSIPVFQDCEPHEIMRMIQGLVSHLALPSDVLIQIGSMGRGLFFIMRGTVNIKRKQPKLTSAQLAEIKFKFDAMDINASGSIDFKELRAAIRSLGYNFRSSDLRKLMDGIDSDGSGLIEFPEFCEMLLKNKEFLAAVYPDALADFDDGVDQSDGFFGEESTLSKRPSTLKVQAVTYCDFLVLPVDLLNSILEKNEKMRALVEEYALRVHRTGVLRPRAEQHGLATTGERQSTAGERLARCFCQAASTSLKPRRSPSPPPSCGANSLLEA